MSEIASGRIRKMRSTLDLHKSQSDVVSYALPIDDDRVPLNPLIGKAIRLEFSGEILCLSCGRKTKKSFSQGYCYPCFASLPETDMCIVKPEQCHHHKGTCRNAAWGEQHCMIDHTIYLSNASGVKVGITRSHQRLTRWIDQGAIQALPIAEVGKRLHSGRIEVALKEFVSDKTNWRTMLKGEAQPVDLKAKAEELIARIPDALAQEVDLRLQPSAEEVRITYPVETFPTKIISLNFDKTPIVEGVLLGIKGQYLILDTGVLNIRKFGGYRISLAA